MTRLAILWHMHQPYYEDLVTHEHILPWVRLHALKDYYGMVALTAEFPELRVTFNLVPSLLVQLEAFAAGRARDAYLDLGLKPAEELTAGDQAFIVQNFFHAQQQRMIQPYPRYAELLARRGSVRTAAEAGLAARRFALDDWRDLQVWQKLAWLDPYYLEGDQRVRALVAKDREFTEADKADLRAVELELLNAVIPAYRTAASSGRIEISASPFYHPILPLLCDTDVYRRTHPDSPRPRQRFEHPEDALEQLTRAAVCHERMFGSRPVGLWPSEGSVSDAMVPMVARAGFSWMATDEEILARTLGITFARDGHGHVDQPERLYRPYSVRAGGAEVSCLFRDRALSDLIGFTYGSWPADAAADDFVGRLVEAGRRYRAQTGGGEAVIPIVLDGENAWEHFEGGGRPFLRALYRRLSHHPELKTVTMAEACGATTTPLDGIFPGSWIDANFYIWIGHADDRRAWSQLADARDALEASPTADPHAAALAREEVLIAEGSDWFWWYGDDHSSEHDLEFDDLFRRHLRNVYRLLNRPVPDELFVSNISAGVPPSPETAPTMLVTPTIDGEESSYFEWLGAGSLEVREVAGAMHQGDRVPAVLTWIRFGFDRDCLYVRMDGIRPFAQLLDDGYMFSITFLRPEGLRVLVQNVDGQPVGRFWRRAPQGFHWTETPASRPRVAAAGVLEIAMPLVDLGLSASEPGAAFFVAVSDAQSLEVERHPAHRPIEVPAGEALFEASMWSV
jgi:alpha-amylase/alpha-mannosidase (GH57 family)